MAAWNAPSATMFFTRTAPRSVILLGTEYWSGLIAWMRDTVLVGQKISPEDLEIFHVTDDVEAAVRRIVEARDRRTDDLIP